jgi:hypothetical protein
MNDGIAHGALWNEHQAAEYLSVKVATLRHWRHKMRGPRYLKFQKSQTIRYRQSDLDEFLSASVVEPRQGQGAQNG